MLELNVSVKLRVVKPQVKHTLLVDFLAGQNYGGRNCGRSKLWTVKNMAEFPKTRHISTHHKIDPTFSMLQNGQLNGTNG